MSHLDYVRPGGIWANEMVPGANDYQRLDDHQARIINGDAGGVWTPTSPIGIGGAGVALTSTGNAIQGGVTTKTGGRVVLAAGIGTANIPSLFSSTGDTITMSCFDLAVPLGQLAGNPSWLADDYLVTSTGPQPVGAQGLASLESFQPIPRRYLHQGASFSKLRWHFRVPVKPASNSNVPFIDFAPAIYKPSTQSPYLAYGPSNFSLWQSSFPFTLGTYVTPSPTPTNYDAGYYYKATSVSGTGTSGTNAAIFNGVTTVGATVTDNPGANQIVWTCMGFSGHVPQFGVDAAAYYNNGNAQVVEFDFDNSTGGLLAASAVDHSTYTYTYSVVATNDVSSLISSLNIEVLSVQLLFTNIVDLRFT